MPSIGPPCGVISVRSNVPSLKHQLTKFIQPHAFKWVSPSHGRLAAFVLPVVSTVLPR